MAKMQLPVIGGIRKVLKVPQAGTQIEGFTSLTVAQLQELLGVTPATPTLPNTQSKNPAAFLSVVGPGLSGGGPILGTVRVNFTPPFWGFDDPEDPTLIPGPSGTPGPAGVPGTSGIVLFEPENSEDPLSIFTIPA